MSKEILKELEESIEGCGIAGGDNDYDKGYYDALIMVRDKIVKPQEEEDGQ